MTTQEILEAARAAKRAVALASSRTRQSVLERMADALCAPDSVEAILAANAEDMAAAKGHISDVMLDRLALTPERIGAMAKGILEVAALPDPVGAVLNRVERPNGLVIEKTAVPMGVIAIIYESRPNVTSDAAAHTMAEKLRAKGAKVVEMDLTRTDVSYAVTEAFRCGRIVLACATYDGFLFPPMENLLAHLKTKNFQGRTVGLMENGTWAPMAAKLMRAELDGMKNITVCDAVVTIRSAANAAAEAQMDVLADELLAK